MGRPLITFINGQPQVSIFRDGIRTDTRLPKFTEITTGDEKSTTPQYILDIVNRTSDVTLQTWSVGETKDQKRPGFLKRLLNKVRPPKRKVPKEENKMNISEFFTDVKASLTEEEGSIYAKRIGDFTTYMRFADMSGQTALCEKLNRQAAVAKYESILYAKGLVRAISEDTLKTLAENAPSTLCLDYVANYIRRIPLEAVKKKVEADKLMVFDNYVILHYDKEDDNTAKTEEEIKQEEEARRDPILFGVIANSNKLYYVCDWIDDTCDLTLEKVAEIVGNEMLEHDNITEDPTE